MTLGNSTSEMFMIGIIEPSEIPVKIKVPLEQTASPTLVLQFKQRGRKEM